jgi:hypothetical protein
MQAPRVQPDVQESLFQQHRHHLSHGTDRTAERNYVGDQVFTTHTGVEVAASQDHYPPPVCP